MVVRPRWILAFSVAVGCSATGIDDGPASDAPAPAEPAASEPAGSTAGSSGQARNRDAGSGTSGEGGSSSSGGTTKSCSQSATCNVGGPLTFCTTMSSGGQCTHAEYTHDGKAFACESCTDCTAAAQSAVAECTGGGSSSGGSSSSSSGGGGGATPTQTCTPVGAACVAGGPMSYCYTFNGSTCTNAMYKHGSKSFACKSCSDCTAAYGQAYVSCQDAVGGCTKLASCCNSLPSPHDGACQQTYNAYQGQPMADYYCKAAYENYRQSNLCF